MNSEGHQIRRIPHRFPDLINRLRAFSCRPPSANTIRHFIFRTTAVFTAACFLFTSVIGPAAYALPLTGGTTAAADRQPAAAEFILPAGIGRITDANFAGSGRIVIVIQDLHCHPEVQKNISAMLSLFDSAFGLRKVYSEGAVGRVDTSWAEAIADPAARRKVVEALVETGKLTGAECYSILSGKPGLVAGLEDEALYAGNLARLGELMRRRQEPQEALPEIRARLAALKQRHYGPEMFRFERLAAGHRDGKLPSDRYYRMLIAWAERMAVDLHDYRGLKEYLAVTKLQKRLDGKRAGRQLEAFLPVLKETLPYTAYRPLADAAGDPARRDELAARLSRLPAEYGIRFDDTYPELARSLALAERARKVNPAELLREERLLSRELRRAIARSGAEREIAFLADSETLLEEYLYNRITAEDYAYFAANRERFELYWKKYTGDDVLARLKPYAALCDEFYRVNLERNGRFIRNLLGETPLSAAPVRFVPAVDHAAQVLAALRGAGEIEVVIAGGFHTDGLKGLLRERDISWLVITPNVTGGTAFAQSVYDGLAREQGRILSQTLQVLIGWQSLDHAAGPRDYARVAARHIDGNFIDGLAGRGLGREAVEKTIDEMLSGVRERHGKAAIPGKISFRFVEFDKDGEYVCDITLGQDSFRYATRKGEVSFEPAPAPQERPGVRTRFIAFLGGLLHLRTVPEDPGAALGADRLVASLGDAPADRLNEALQIVYDRKFFTEGQLKELLPRLRFKVTEDKDILVDLQPLEGGAWTIAVNRVLLEEYPYVSSRTRHVLRLKLAYLIARKMDSLSFGAFARARHLDANLAERKAVVYLRDTGRVNLHPKDAELLLEFPSLLAGLNRTKKDGCVSPAIARYEREYAGLLRHVLGGRFYGFTFVGEPEWLKLVGDFIVANREYYRHQWWSGLTLFLDHFLILAQNLDHRDILRFLRWYENDIDYWQEGGTYVNTGGRRLFANDFPSGGATPVPFKYNYNDQDPDAVYSGGVVERILLEKVPGEPDASLIEETILKVHGEKVSLDDIKGVYVRELGEGQMKRAFYVIAVTPRGCFEFVLLMAAYNDRLEDFIGNITLEGEEEALAWGGAQFPAKTPVRGARIPPGATFGVRHRGALTVSYMGHNLWDLVDKKNWKLTKEGKLYLLKRGITTYFESVFRFGATTIVEDLKPDNVASLDTHIGIVDFGFQREGEMVYDIALYLKGIWVKVPWQFAYLSDTRDYIFDAFMDVFAGTPYGAAAGADLLRQALADPFEVGLPDDLRSALAAYLRTGVVKYLRATGNTEIAHPLGEPDWKHISETYRSLSPDTQIVFNKSFGARQEKDAYWFMGRALGIAPDTAESALSDDQVRQLLARFRRESLAVPGRQVLQLLRIWAKRYGVAVDAIRDAETYQALLRTLYVQAALKISRHPAKGVTVVVTNDDREIAAGLTAFQVRDILDEFIKAGARPGANLHIDFRTAEVILSLLERRADGRPGLEERYAAARAAFVARGGEKTVAPDERDPAAILDAAVAANHTRLVIADRELARRVAELAREQCVVIGIKLDEGMKRPGTAEDSIGIAAGEDGLVASLGDPAATQRLNEALQMIYDREFFTSGQLKDLLPKLRFRVTDDRDILVDARPAGNGAWTIAINRVMFDGHRDLPPRARSVMQVKLAYLIARKMDSLSFGAFADARYLDANLAERKAVVYLRDTGRIKLHPGDAGLLLEFPSLIRKLNLGRKHGFVSPAIVRYEQAYGTLLRHVLGGGFYGFTFVGEPEWLQVVSDFIAANREYYRHQWWSGFTLFIDQFLTFTQNLDHHNILRFLRWYENYRDYWQEGGVFVNTDRRRLVEKEFPAGDGVSIPFTYNYAFARGQDPGSYYSWLFLEQLLLEKVPGKIGVSLIEETIRKVHGTEVTLGDLKAINVRELGQGQMKRGFYVIVVTAKGCFEFVLLLPSFNEDHGEFVRELTVEGEEEALAWGGAQFTTKTPVVGVRLPPGRTGGESYAGALTVSYMGHNLRELLNEQNWKLTNEGKMFLLKRGMMTYFENIFRFGGTTMIDDMHTGNIASLDTRVGIVDFGLQSEGDLVIDLSQCLLVFSTWPSWQFSYLPGTRDYIFDTYMDIFAGAPYAEAAGADLLRQALADPYEIPLPDELKSAIAAYLKDGVIRQFLKPGKTQIAHPLGEPDWAHINETFRFLDPDRKIVFNKSVYRLSNRDAYWFLGRSLGFAPDTAESALSDEQVLKVLARFRRETLAFPGRQVLQLLRTWAKRYDVSIDALRDAETYQALLRTLSEQAVRKARGHSLQRVAVTVTDADREIASGLTLYQAGEVLSEFIAAGARSEENVHVDFRKAEVLISLLGRERGGRYPELEGRYAAARAAFVARGGEKTVAPGEKDPAAILEAAVAENCTRLVIADRELAQRVAERARAQYVVVDIRSDGQPLPGDTRKEKGKLSAILRAVQTSRWARIAGRQAIVAARVPLMLIGRGLGRIDPRFRDLPVRKTAPALLLNGYVTTSGDPAYLRHLAAQGVHVVSVSRAEPGIGDRKLFRVALPLKDTAGETVLLDVYGRSTATRGGRVCRLSYRLDQTLSEGALKLLPAVAPWCIGMELEKDLALRQELGIPLFRFDEYELTADAGSPGDAELAALQALKDAQPRLRGTVFVYDERPGAPAAARHGLAAIAAAGRVFDRVVRDGDLAAKLRLLGAMKERRSAAGLMQGDSRISVTYGDDIAALMDEARIARYRESGADTFMLPWNGNRRLARAVRDRLHAAGLRTGSVFAAADAAGLAAAQKDMAASVALGDAAVRLDLRGAAAIDEALVKEILALAQRVRAAEPESSLEIILPGATALKEYAAACRTFEAAGMRIVVTASPADVLSSPAAALIRKGLLKRPLLEITDTVDGLPCDVEGIGEELQAKLNDLFRHVSDFGISARMMDWYREAYYADPGNLLSLKNYLLGLLKADPLRQGRSDAAALSDAAVRAVGDRAADRILALLRAARAHDAAAAGSADALVDGFRDALKNLVPADAPGPAAGEETAAYIAYGRAFCTGLMERFAERFIDPDRPFVSDRDRKTYVTGIVEGLLLLEGTPLNALSSADDLIAALDRLPSSPLEPGIAGDLNRLSRGLSAPLFRATVNRLAASAPTPRSIAELLRLLALADRDEKGMIEHLKESLDAQVLPAATRHIISAA